MTPNISSDVFILSARDLEERERRSFLRGVERGKFEAKMASSKEPVAINCANWNDGHCETCGVQWQGMEVGANYPCPHFTRRAPAPIPQQGQTDI